MPLLKTPKMELDELEHQYSPSRWATRLTADAIIEAHRSVLLEATKTAQQSVLQCEVGIEYLEPGGPQLDIYHHDHPPPTASSLSDAVFVYFHGGYWQDLGVEYAGACAIPLTKNGVTTVAIGHTLAPKASLSVIVDQCRRAVVYTHKRFPNKRIFIAGHSSGGHLAAMMMVTDWSQYGIETQPLSGSILISGVFDLTPLQRTYINDAVHITADEMRDLSPMLQADKLRGLAAGFPCLLVWGEEESPEFKRQSREFSQELVARGVRCTSEEIEGRDHFDVAERLREEEDTLTQMILKFL